MLLFLNLHFLYSCYIKEEKTIWQRLEKVVVDKSTPMVFSAIVDRVIFHPIETVITLQQSKKYGSSLPSNFIRCSIEFYRNEGPSAFYRGFTWPTLTSIPNRFMVFGTYFIIKETFNEFSPAQKFACSGIGAAIIKSIISCPSETIRTQKFCKVIIPRNYNYTYFLFRGFIPLSIKYISALAPTLGGTDYILYLYPELRHNHMGPFLVASSVSFAFQFVATPADILKTRMMENYSNGLKYHITDVWNERSLMYRKFLPRALRSSARAGMNLGILHLCMSLLNKNYEEDFI